MTPFIPVPYLRAWGKSQICPSHLLHGEKKICRIASIGHHVVKRECTQSKVLRTETLLIPMINLNISRTSYQENCATIFQPYPSSWLHAGESRWGGEKSAPFQVLAFILVEEQSSGQFGSVSALCLSATSSEAQRISEHELFLLISVFMGEVLEGAGATEDISRSAPWNQGGSEPL